MSKYATQRTYDGRRARCGDIVVIACPKYDMRKFAHLMPQNVPEQKMCLRAGIVGSISASKDIPYLRDLREGSQDADPEWWLFVATRTEEDIEKLEIGEWTWPLDLVMRRAEGSQASMPPTHLVPVAPLGEAV